MEQFLFWLTGLVIQIILQIFGLIVQISLQVLSLTIQLLAKMLGVSFQGFGWSFHQGFKFFGFSLNRKKLLILGPGEYIKPSVQYRELFDYSQTADRGEVSSLFNGDYKNGDFLLGRYVTFRGSLQKNSATG